VERRESEVRRTTRVLKVLGRNASTWTKNSLSSGSREEFVKTKMQKKMEAKKQSKWERSRGARRKATERRRVENFKDEPHRRSKPVSGGAMKKARDKSQKAQPQRQQRNQVQQERWWNAKEPREPGRGLSRSQGESGRGLSRSQGESGRGLPRSLQSRERGRAAKAPRRAGKRVDCKGAKERWEEGGLQRRQESREEGYQGACRAEKRVGCKGAKDEKTVALRMGGLQRSQETTQKNFEIRGSTLLLFTTA
jgi:hypothetical protein